MIIIPLIKRITEVINPAIKEIKLTVAMVLGIKKPITEAAKNIFPKSTKIFAISSFCLKSSFRITGLDISSLKVKFETKKIMFH